MSSALQQTAQHEVDEGRFAGISWHVETRGEIVDRGAVGHVDHAFSQDLSTDAIVRIYSMTKPLVSMLAVMLVEQGRLSLSTPVAHYFESFGKAGVLRLDGSHESVTRAVTIEDLLTHRAGLSYDFMPECPVAALYRDAGFVADGSRPLQRLAEELSALPLARQPGSGWYYSYGTDVMAAIIEKVLDQPLIDALRDAFLDPLGMSETRFGVARDSVGRLADMFGAHGLDIVPSAEPREQTVEPVDVEASYPSNRPEQFARGGLGLFSTLDDYAAFMRFLFDGCDAGGSPLIGPQWLERAWQNRLPDDQRPIGIAGRAYPGYGWGLFGRVMVDSATAELPVSEGEGGWSGAASTWFWVDRAKGFSGVVFAQYLGSQVHLGERMQAVAYSDFL